MWTPARYTLYLDMTNESRINWKTYCTYGTMWEFTCQIHTKKRRHQGCEKCIVYGNILIIVLTMSRHYRVCYFTHFFKNYIWLKSYYMHVAAENSSLFGYLKWMFEDGFLVKILLAAAKKAITRKWCRRTLPLWGTGWT